MKIVVALSGGVDSSVSIFLLKQAGYDVTALFMKNWDDSNDPDCPAARDYEDALMVADKLGVPLHAFNFAESYWDNVFSHFIEELKQGYTPNPDILCNREIKFKVLLDKAKELGADMLATGHYAQIVNGNLVRGIDRNKDQSYFLYAINRGVLDKVMFPIGALEKSYVRALAKENNLVTHDKRDSTGICFIGKRKFSDFISKYMPPTKGYFKTLEGEILGEHNGAWFYTIGQRKGLGIGGAKGFSSGEAWFVADKDITTHDVIVVQGEDHTALYSDELTATDINWLKSDLPYEFCCSAKIRYRTPDQKCVVTRVGEEGLKIKFDTPVKAATPRQSIVFYQEETCLGGALIETAKKSLLIES